MDLADCSRAAVDYAALLASAGRASIMLLHVVDPGCYGNGPQTPGRRFSEIQMLARIQMRLGAIAEQAIRGRARCETLVRFGLPQIEIDRVARQHHADLIILATHGERGLPDFCYGSTTEQVLRYAPCPVLVLREQGHHSVDGQLKNRKESYENQTCQKVRQRPRGERSRR